MMTPQTQQPYSGAQAGGAAPPTGAANPRTQPVRRRPGLPQQTGLSGTGVQPTAGGGLAGTGVQPTGTGLTGTAVQPTTPTTPTATQRLRFAGINPAEQRTGLQALQDLERVLGTPLTQQQVQQARTHINYTDPTGAAMMSGADYNRLMQYAAQQAGGDYAEWQQQNGVQPFPTEGPLNPDPFQQPTYEDAPSYQAPTYEEQRFAAPSWEQVQNDPGYQFRRKEGMGALQASAAARGMLGTGTFARDMVNYGQDLASQEYQQAYDRALGTYGVNTDERRFGYNARSEGAQAEYAPRLVTWNARREDGQRAAELTYDRNWQREVYGRDDNYRRNRATEDDYRYRDNRDEMRRRFLAELGQA